MRLNRNGILLIALALGLTGARLGYAADSVIMQPAFDATKNSAYTPGVVSPALPANLDLTTGVTKSNGYLPKGLSVCPTPIVCSDINNNTFGATASCPDYCVVHRMISVAGVTEVAPNIPKVSTPIIVDATCPAGYYKVASFNPLPIVVYQATREDYPKPVPDQKTLTKYGILGATCEQYREGTKTDSCHESYIFNEETKLQGLIYNLGVTIQTNTVIDNKLGYYGITDPQPYVYVTGTNCNTPSPISLKCWMDNTTIDCANNSNGTDKFGAKVSVDVYRYSCYQAAGYQYSQTIVAPASIVCARKSDAWYINGQPTDPATGKPK